MSHSQVLPPDGTKISALKPVKADPFQEL